MAASQAANAFESVAGKADNAITAQGVSNPARGADGGSSQTMKALVWQGKNKVEVVDVPRPTILEDRDVILKITGSTVCGSDLHLYHGTMLQLKKGDILGHEFCGVVDEVGSAVKKVKKGDRVVASFQIACGDCFYCQRKLSSQCSRINASGLEHALFGAPTAGMFGYSHLTGGFAGGQSAYTRVPFGDVNLLKLPSSVPDEKGLYLSDVLVTSYHAVHDTGVNEGDVVAIWGAGPIGEMAATFALQAGAKRVIVIDRVDWRLNRMKNIKNANGRVETLNFSTLPKGETVVSYLKKAVEDRGPDVCIECAAGEFPKGLLHKAEVALGAETDTSEILNEMIESVRNFGRCGITGLYAGFANHVNVGSLMNRGIRLIGNGQAPVHLYWEKLLGMIEKGEIEPLQMVSHRVRLEDTAKVYEIFDKKGDIAGKGVQKVFVETQFSDPPAPGAPALSVVD